MMPLHKLPRQISAITTALTFILIAVTLLAPRTARAQQAAALETPSTAQDAQQQPASNTAPATTQSAPASQSADAQDASDDTDSGIQPPESLLTHFSGSRIWLSGQLNYVF